MCCLSNIFVEYTVEKSQFSKESLTYISLTAYALTYSVHIAHVACRDYEPADDRRGPRRAGEGVLRGARALARRAV